MDVSDIEVIAPNLKRRLSGVTSTIARLVPIQANLIGIAATGSGLPPELPKIPLWRLVFLPKDKFRVWHARRNSEMLLGIALRGIFRRRLKLLFTSASQRQHTWITRWLISRMDAVVATSEKTKSYLKRPATVVMHGIDLAGFSQLVDKLALAGSLGLPQGFVAGCYGRIRHQKGTDIFVDSMIQLMPRFPDLIGVVMGRSTSEHAKFLSGLREKIAKADLQDRLLILPEVPVDQMAKWYQVLDIFVAPQRSEGFGLTPLEAGAGGVATIATKVGAFEDIIVDGVTGRLVGVDDLGAMGDAIGTALENRGWVTNAGNAARAHVACNFRIEDEARALVDMYRKLLRTDGDG